jgi:alpha-glucosidase (family GH31 glycosyl hydrolase)
MKEFVEGLHQQGQHWVAIQDAGVAADKGYKAYEEGTRDRVWVTDHTGNDYLGQVRNGVHLRKIIMHCTSLLQPGDSNVCH